MTQDERALLLAVAATLANMRNTMSKKEADWMWQTIHLIQDAENAMPKRE